MDHASRRLAASSSNYNGLRDISNDENGDSEDFLLQLDRDFQLFQGSSGLRGSLFSPLSPCHLPPTIPFPPPTRLRPGLAPPTLPAVSAVSAMAASGVSPSSSPRLPSPPPFTEVQIGPKSPTVGESGEKLLALSSASEKSAVRRIRPGTRADDMASGPPLVPLPQVGFCTGGHRSIALTKS